MARQPWAAPQRHRARMARPRLWLLLALHLRAALGAGPLRDPTGLSALASPLLVPSGRPSAVFNSTALPHGGLRPSNIQLRRSWRPRCSSRRRAALHAGGLQLPTSLELCECESSRGSPDGLGCEKEGWFVSSFEQRGSWVRPALLRKFPV